MHTRAMKYHSLTQFCLYECDREARKFGKGRQYNGVFKKKLRKAFAPPLSIIQVYINHRQNTGYVTKTREKQRNSQGLYLAAKPNEH
jgi:hypothetical protein